jgi:hypothetical protein
MVVSKLVSLLFKQLFDSNLYISILVRLSVLFCLFNQQEQSKRKHKESLIAIMMKITSTRSEQSSTNRSQEKYGDCILPAALAELPTPKVGTVQSAADEMSLLLQL